MEKLWMWLAWRLPTGLAYWAAVRVFTYATAGPWSNDEVPRVTCIQAMERWHQGHGGDPVKFARVWMGEPPPPGDGPAPADTARSGDDGPSSTVHYAILYDERQRQELEQAGAWPPVGGRFGR